MVLHSQQYGSPFLPYWTALQNRRLSGDQDVVIIDGHTLDIPSVVAVARHGQNVKIHPQALQNLQAAVDGINRKLEDGEIVYGINTGFGGSASSRPSEVRTVQKSLMRLLNYGIITDEYSADATVKSIDEMGTSTSMPEAWVRAAMAIRMNSLVVGVSGVRPLLVKNLASALNKSLVPLVPLRGSISASGDLSPLSYVGAMLQGRPVIRVNTGPTTNRKLVGADQALREANIEPVELEPKEGLAIVNGTAFSGAVGALAVFEAHSLAALSQVSTAMAVESLKGSIESFDAFLAGVRPHPGQIESAANIHAFLEGTRMAVNSAQRDETQQDRYSLRTSTQWLGPVLEDLALADRQIHIEINSVTDNPLITPDGRMLHGGNFQAKVVTSAMEKTRQACQSIGLMLFTQCTEMINPLTSNGLTPNLVVDEPQESWLWKGADIMIASLTSELGFLANPVGSHVKSAEMGNQALNSLALISARYTLNALDVLTQLSTVHVLACCQAMDLRALDHAFLSRLRPHFQAAAFDHFSSMTLPQLGNTALEEVLWSCFLTYWNTHKSQNTSHRIDTGLDNLSHILLKSCVRSTDLLSAIDTWKAAVAERAVRTWTETRAEYLANPDATPLLGAASKRVYAYVRRHLQIPFIGEQHLADAETPDRSAAGSSPNGGKPSFGSLGAMMTVLYASMKSGEFYAVVAACHAEAAQDKARIEQVKASRVSKI